MDDYRWRWLQKNMADAGFQWDLQTHHENPDDSNQYGNIHNPGRSEDSAVVFDLGFRAQRLRIIVGKLHRRTAFDLGHLTDEAQRVKSSSACCCFSSACLIRLRVAPQFHTGMFKVICAE